MANDVALPYPGQNAQQDNREENRKAKTPVETAKNIHNKAKSAVKTGKRIYDTAKKAKAAVQAAQAAVTVANPWVIAIILIVVGLILIYIFFFSQGSALEMDDNNNVPPPSAPSIPGGPSVVAVPGLTITLTTSKPQYENGEDIEYTISYTYDTTIGKSPLEDIVLYDTIPTNASFVSTSGAQTPDSTTSVVSWSLKDPENQKPFKITLHPTNADVYITNTISAKVVATGGSASTTDTCGGEYDLTATPLGTNFGDPLCDFTKDGLYTLLQSLDPVNANKWYYQIIPCESGYSPNAYNGASYSGSGAYGLFQMNPSNHGYDINDAGDVSWNQQTTNAIAYNGKISNSFTYWACAR